jgi:hypothetical protein
MNGILLTFYEAINDCFINITTLARGFQKGIGLEEGGLRLEELDSGRHPVVLFLIHDIRRGGFLT